MLPSSWPLLNSWPLLIFVHFHSCGRCRMSHDLRYQVHSNNTDLSLKLQAHNIQLPRHFKFNITKTELLTISSKYTPNITLSILTYLNFIFPVVEAKNLGVLLKSSFFYDTSVKDRCQFCLQNASLIEYFSSYPIPPLVSHL